MRAVDLPGMMVWIWFVARWACDLPASVSGMFWCQELAFFFFFFKGLQRRLGVGDMTGI